MGFVRFSNCEVEFFISDGKVKDITIHMVDEKVLIEDNKNFLRKGKFDNRFNTLDYYLKCADFCKVAINIIDWFKR